MPELPEVETIRRDLVGATINKEIEKVAVFNDKIVRNDNESFSLYLKGKKFESIERIGKLLIFKIDSKNFLLVHLKMTGQLIYQKKDKILAGGHSLSQKGSVMDRVGGRLPNKYTHVIITFKDKTKLYFNDLRRFGYLELVGGKDLKKIKERFGIEPLTDNFVLHEFDSRIRKRKTYIKNVLLNQRIIAGIGNIYADEILFASGVRPNRRANKVQKSEIEKIFNQANIILDKAIEARGTTFSDYVDTKGKKGGYVNFLKVYGRGGKECLKCSTEITKIKLAGRGTHYCKKCQK